MSEITKEQMLEHLRTDGFEESPFGTCPICTAIVCLIEFSVKHSGEQPLVTYRLRPAVAAFAALMEAELRKHDDRPGWKGCDPHWLLARLNEEVIELANALLDHSESLPHEAADIANFAMMIADVEGGLKVSGEQPAPPTPGEEERREMLEALDEAIATWMDSGCFYAPENQEIWNHIRAFVAAPPPAKVSREAIKVILNSIEQWEKEDWGPLSWGEYVTERLREKGIAVSEAIPNGIAEEEGK